MNKSIFAFLSYKAVINEKIASTTSGRGYLRSLAIAAGCQPSYLSTVIRGDNNLTPDHALGLCYFWKLNPKETDYFLALVEHERCGTALMKVRLTQKLNQMRQESENIGTRLNRPPPTQSEFQLKYYSSWVYSAIHILVSFPGYKTNKSISERLSLPPSDVTRYLQELEEAGLVKANKKEWEFISQSVHIPRHSPLVSLHHSNWRQRAILDSQQPEKFGTHYTTVTALSSGAAKEIKDLILSFIDEFSAIADPSESQELKCLNIDFFEI